MFFYIFGIMALLMLAAVCVYLFFIIRRLLKRYTRLAAWPVRLISAAGVLLMILGCMRFGTVCAIIGLHLVGAYALLDAAALLASVCGKVCRRLASRPGRLSEEQYSASRPGRLSEEQYSASRPGQPSGDPQSGLPRGGCLEKAATFWKSFTGICRRIYRSSLVPAAAAAAVLLYGFLNMQHAVMTEYELTTEKPVQGLRILFVSDTHYDTIQDTGLLKDKVEEMKELRPDIVILGGDIVEEGTSKESMEEVFALFGTIGSTYGVYYVYGNHDRQLYRTERNYTIAELRQAIEGSGIRILQDEWVELGGQIVLAGREDASIRNRAAAEQVLSGIDQDKYIILADHQPLGAEKNAELGVDLMISGHTHAGQIWPINLFNELTGLNYGYYREGCDVIVSSGFTGWGFPIRTSAVCEYVLAVVNPQKD